VRECRIELRERECRTELREAREAEEMRESKSLQMRTWIQVKKERLPQMFGLILQGRKLMEKLKPNAIIVTNFTWVSLAKVQLICVII